MGHIDSRAETRTEPVALAPARACPTLPGATRPLIEHRIEVPQCLERQRTLYHKCHRCVYRGKPATFVADRPTPMPGAGVDTGTPVALVDLPITPPVAELAAQR